MKPKKSQSSFEFIVLASVMMLIFIIFFGITTSKITEFAAERNHKVANDIIDTIFEEVSIAHSSLDGYSRVFVLPSTINGDEYELSIYRDRILFLRYKDKNYDRDLPENVFGTVYKGDNNIRKTEGMIVLSADDPCTPLPPLQNSFCIGGFFYCFNGFYDTHCEREDDILVGYCNSDPKPSGCTDPDAGCLAHDSCNFAPGIILPGPAFDSTLAANDTQVRMLFSTNESAQALINYSSSFINKFSVMTGFSSDFSVMLDRLTPMTDYDFTINLTDAKKASQVYPGCCNNPPIAMKYKFKTGPDKTPPIIEDAAATLGDGTEKQSFNYMDRVKIGATVKEYTGVGSLTATIKLGSQVITSVQVSNCISSCQADTMEDRFFESDPFTIDNMFATGASYGNDAHTLFYAGFDGTYSGASAGQTPVDTGALPQFAAGRFDRGIRMENPAAPNPGSRLAYESEGNINPAEGTIEFWAYPFTYADGYLFDVSSYPLGNSNKKEMEMEKTSSALVFRIYDDNGAVHALSDNAGLQAGEWHFIAVTWKNMNSGGYAELKLYVDGERKAILDGDAISLNFADRNAQGYGTDIGVGYSLENPTAVLRADSVIDQLRISDYAKTEAELLQDYSTNQTYTIDFYAEDTTSNCNSGPCKRTYPGFMALNASYARSAGETG